jgi:hypothetical protein
VPSAQAVVQELGGLAVGYAILADMGAQQASDAFGRFFYLN